MKVRSVNWTQRVTLSVSHFFEQNFWWPGWSGWLGGTGGTGGMGGIVLRVYEFEMYYGYEVFICFRCFLSQEQQQYTSLLLTGLLTDVSR